MSLLSSASMMALEKTPLWAWGALKRHKTQKVLEEMQNGGFTVEQAMSSDSEIYRFTTFLEALGRAASYEKATLLKELYLSERRAVAISDDFFMEIFSILGDLSDREIKLLHLVDCYHKGTLESALGVEHGALDNHKPKPSDMDEGGVDSDAFFGLVGECWKTEPEMLEALMHRLQRTGMVVRSGLDWNSRFTKFRPSVLYREVYSRVTRAIDESDDVTMFTKWIRLL